MWLCAHKCVFGCAMPMRMNVCVMCVWIWVCVCAHVLCVCTMGSMGTMGVCVCVCVCIVCVYYRRYATSIGQVVGPRGSESSQFNCWDRRIRLVSSSVTSPSPTARCSYTPHALLMLLYSHNTIAVHTYTHYVYSLVRPSM